MDVDRDLQEHVVFHLSGRRAGARLESIEELRLRPALMARFHNLTRLRYDYPVVLVDRADAECLCTLSGVMNALLNDVAPRGIEGERMRRNVLRLEREIRILLGKGMSGTLSMFWTHVARELVSKGGTEVEADLARARTALRIDGEVVDCDPTAAERLVTHAWRTVQEAKLRKMRRAIETLAVRLSDLVKADYLRSETGRRASVLRAGIGAPHQDLFDFDAMARLLAKPSGKSALPESRRRRIEATLTVLRTQRFFATDGSHPFRYDDVASALGAFRERLPEMAELVKAIAVAELEVEGRYLESKHDPIFVSFDQSSLGPQDLALFPDYLVCVSGRDGDPAMQGQLITALAEGAPLKVLVEVGDLLNEPALGDGHLSIGAQLARSATSLNDVFVLQSASSNLYRMREKLVAAMKYPGAALISVFSGAAPGAGSMRPYLLAAAAMQSRAFPAFTCDPTAGADWVERFSLEGNPQPERPWPVDDFVYADGSMQRVDEQLAFTFVDFAACDARYARHFARVPPERWNGSMVFAADWLAEADRAAPERVPCIYAIDDESRLHKLIVDEKLVHAARRCAEAWRWLQEIEGRKRATATVAAVPAAPVVEIAALDTPAVPGESPQDEHRSDDPYIETARCTSCNECVQINNAMFAYDANQQAYVANADAGTYAQLVEAAESCQVAIIHPGKPRNPNEPGLDELVKRAAVFL
jgi:ferredoxin